MAITGIKATPFIIGGLKTNKWLFSLAIIMNTTKLKTKVTKLPSELDRGLYITVPDETKAMAPIGLAE